MNLKVRNAIFFLMVFVLIFDYIPKPVQLNFLGGPAGSKLIVYPLLVAFGYSVYCHYKHGGVFVDFRKFARYVAVFIGVMLLSTACGLIMYPYWDLVLSGPVNQIEKLPKVMEFLASHGMAVDQRLLMSCWIIARQVKGTFLDAFWCFGASYLVYCWYKEDWRTALRIAVKAALWAFGVLFLYAIAEVAYLAGNPAAAKILSTINPYIHPIVTNHGWWPPLLWKGQLRLVFPEPSHVGNYIAFGLPFLWYMYFEAGRKKAGLALLMTVVMSFLVFLTKARTAYGMLIGMVVLLLCLILLGRQFGLLKKFAALVAAVAIGFGGFVSFDMTMQAVAASAKAKSVTAKAAPAKPKPKPKPKSVTAQAMAAKAVENNFLSLVMDNKRSNGARYSLLRAHFRTGMEHPILGVGRGLTGAYVAEHFTKAEAKNKEVASWIRYQKKHGPMASGYSIPDAMNEFVSRFSTTGILGLLTVLFPFSHVLMKLLKDWMRCGSHESMFVAFALISSLVAGCNGSWDIIFGVWLLLGLSYAVVRGKA